MRIAPSVACLARVTLQPSLLAARCAAAAG